VTGGGGRGWDAGTRAARRAIIAERFLLVSLSPLVCPSPRPRDLTFHVIPRRWPFNLLIESAALITTAAREIAPRYEIDPSTLRSSTANG